MPLTDRNFKDKTGPLVRVHLRLPQPHLAENVIRLRTGAGTFPSVAYARELILRNVTAIVDENLRRRIESGEIGKTPCGFLEGELVAWTGRWRDKAAPDHKGALAVLRRDDLSVNGLEEGIAIGFNPKKLRHFYAVPESGDLRDVFLGASDVAVCHWYYRASGPILRPAEAGDYAVNPAPPSGMETDSLRRGRACTARRLAERGLTRG